jgi:hypothetical protein
MPKKPQSKETKVSDKKPESSPKKSVKRPRKKEPIEPHEIASGMTPDQMEKFLDKLMQLSKKQEGKPQQTAESLSQEQEDNYSEECEDARNLYPLDPQMMTDEEEASERALAQWLEDFKARNPDYNPLSSKPKKEQS